MNLEWKDSDDKDRSNDIHEPADELPEDCRVEYHPENDDNGRKQSGD